MIKNSLLLLIVLSLYNCKPQKIYIETIKTERDSIYIDKVIKETERFTDTISIENPCDTITGNLKPFKQVISTKQGKITIQNKNGKIQSTIDLKGYKDVLEKEYQSKLKESSKVSEKTIYKTPFNMWVILVLSLLLNFYLIFKRR